MTAGYTLPRSTLLVVDGDTQQIAALRTMFSLEYNIEVAKEGKQAINSAFDLDIDLILCAVNSPNISGPELCALVKNNPLTRHIPIILLADKASPEEEQMCLEVGAIDYISRKTLAQILHLRVRNHMILVEHQKMLEYVSSTDGLTGLANRMQLDTTLNRVWHAAIRAGNSIGLLMIDIDHFKFYNDEFGHVQGDECLKMVASAIANSKCREEDFAARYGGEEFVLLLPYTTLEGAKKVAKQLLKNIRQLNIPAAQRAETDRVTVSVGVAAISPKFDPIQNISPMELINQADMQLFKAKRSGRDRLC
jgi:diguanylate cyclase (GGDEF)-like protein